MLLCKPIIIIGDGEKCAGSIEYIENNCRIKQELQLPRGMGISFDFPPPGKSEN